MSSMKDLVKKAAAQTADEAGAAPKVQVADSTSLTANSSSGK
jgi:hypothetical protein